MRANGLLRNLRDTNGNSILNISTDNRDFSRHKSVPRHGGDVELAFAQARTSNNPVQCLRVLRSPHPLAIASNIIVAPPASGAR
jgi:hypothetical protein